MGELAGKAKPSSALLDADDTEAARKAAHAKFG